MGITIKRAAKLLSQADNITILCHHKPDGDALGCGFALYYALRSLGKTARVLCPDAVPLRYDFLNSGYIPAEVLPEPREYVVAVDLADMSLLDELGERYTGRVDLCIDHHLNPRPIAKASLVEPKCAAAAELIYAIIKELHIPITHDIAVCIYTGLSTDTGCFRYSNTTANTLRCAADMMDTGINTSEINIAMFESKSRGRIQAEAALLSGMEFFFDGRCALITISRALRQKTGVTDYDLEDIPTLPRAIEGVRVGVTVREEDGFCRISVRSAAGVDSAEICRAFGGGGHVRAGGCSISGTLGEARQLILSEVEKHLD